MVGHRAPLSREAVSRAVVRPVRLLAGLALPQQGGGGGPAQGRTKVGPRADLLIFPHLQGRSNPDMFFQNPMFSRPKLAFGPCGAHPPSYMSVNHRNIADV